ncbi:class I SAM-dependent methyltransferase [Saccharothrix sp. AJ9571]|nr:class I SAM-dependent methyltransferase [Saccharothrix sp. AJ9571]
MDAAHLDFADGSFDLAAAGFVVQVLDDPAAVLGEVHRVLRPGGIVALSLETQSVGRLPSTTAARSPRIAAPNSRRVSSKAPRQCTTTAASRSISPPRCTAPAAPSRCPVRRLAPACTAGHHRRRGQLVVSRGRRRSPSAGRATNGPPGGRLPGAAGWRGGRPGDRRRPAGPRRRHAAVRSAPAAVPVRPSGRSPVRRSPVPRPPSPPRPRWSRAAPRTSGRWAPGRRPGAAAGRGAGRPGRVAGTSMRRLR